MNTNFNPNSILQMIAQGQNPQQLVMNYLESQMQNSPLGENLLTLAKSNRTAEIEQIARNLCAQRGGNFDVEFNAFKRQLGIK